MNVVRTIALAAAALAVTAGAASAQNYNLRPTYGSVYLQGGFTPDPYNIGLSSGGSIDASSAIGGNCRGYIANAPDFELTYDAGSLPLIISVASSYDTTLVINGPDGRWYCDDDSGREGLNPSINFGSGRSGVYHIWVGTYGGTSLRPATLSISELYSF